MAPATAKIMQTRAKDIEFARNGLRQLQFIQCKDNANESKGHLSLLEMSFAECSLSSAKILNSVY